MVRDHLRLRRRRCRFPHQHGMSARNPKTDSEFNARRMARRQLIRSALGAAPVVFTITAGTAHAAYGSGYSTNRTEEEQEEALQGMQAAGLADEFGMPSEWDGGDPLFGS